jgi:hypothetical protein
MRSFEFVERRFGDNPPTQPSDEALAGHPSASQIRGKTGRSPLLLAERPITQLSRYGSLRKVA